MRMLKPGGAPVRSAAQIAWPPFSLRERAGWQRRIQEPETALFSLAHRKGGQDLAKEAGHHAHIPATEQRVVGEGERNPECRGRYREFHFDDPFTARL